MLRSRPRTVQIPRPRRWWPAALVVAAVLAAAVPAPAPASASAGQPTKVVTYHGYRVTVPRGWPVFRLATDPTACVRFDRHAVYLGRPGAAQRCPAVAVGRTEAILVAPLAVGSGAPGAAGAGAGAGAAAGGAFLPQPSLAAAAPGAGSSARLVKPARGVVVTVTWNRHPATIARAVGVRSPARAAAASRRTPPRATLALRRARVRPALARPRAAARVAVPGGIYTGPAFDACSTPSLPAMAAWSASPYRALGVYIGGANMACSQANLNATWVGEQSAAGWSLIPIYVGLQAPGNSCGCAAISPATAAVQGTAAAQDAIVQAQAIGLGAGNPIYDDMEAYSRTSANTATVLAFLGAWTAQLHAGGYLSGVYSSGNSGIADLVAEVGTGYLEPDDIWVADWNNEQTTLDPSLPATDWPTHQRLHQYSGAHDEAYAGQTINIDGDYVDAATAAAGTGTGAPAVPAPPTLLVKPVAAGTTDVYPHWKGVTGISSWQVLAGPSPTALTAVGTPAAAGRPGAIGVAGAYPYVAVAAMGADGGTLGTSAPVATPAHVALFGRSAFVSQRGVGGLPVSCFSASPCRDVITVTEGRTTITTTGPEHVPAGGGGLAFFKLSPGVRIRLRRSAHRGLLVRVTVHDLASGSSASRPQRLLGFTTSGASPLRSIAPSQDLRIIGATDFVSHGWVGGILAGCFAAAPCSATITLTAGRTVVARSKAQVVGVNQLGYLTFTLTAAGHRLLTGTAGNQLGVRLTISTSGAGPATAGAGGAATATPATSASAIAQIALASF